MMEHQPEPRRPISLVVLSLVVLTGCVLLSSAAIALFSVTWDPCSWMSGVILLPLPVVLAIQQYRGTFRYNAKAAWMSSVLLFIVAGLAFWMFAEAHGDMMLESVRLDSEPLFLPILVFGIAAVASGWRNLSWSRFLERSAMTQEQTTDRRGFTLREILGVVSASACISVLVVHFAHTIPPRYAEDVSRRLAPFGLPAEATEISYCKGFRGTIAYEFTVDEAGFVRWVESGIGSSESEAANVSLEQITKPYTTPRYHSLTPDLMGPDSITITEGFRYHWSKEDRGVYAAFDRTTGRGYYFAHFH